MKSLQTESKDSGRLISIDALRGIAALGVVLYHAVLQTSHPLPNNLLQWPVKGIQFLSSFGYIGVFLFFVISGFCIHLQWARARVKTTEPQVQFGSFWKRRLRRLYPPYLIALGLYLTMAALSTGIDLTHFFVYDLVMHLLMLHNLDPATCYSINGVFWTLAIEEQLYLAYFLLLFLRKRFGWAPTLVICLLSRVGWFYFSHAIWLATGVGVPVPEAALSHWFTWALGAIAVEAWFGLVKLPKWCRNFWIGAVAVVVGSAISDILPVLSKDTPLHSIGWLVMHPILGFGFFVLVNCAVGWERRRVVESIRFVRTRRIPVLVSAAATLGLFSYSLYLTHELVIMQAWRFPTPLPPILHTLLFLVPLTVIFAWIFFNWCELPYMKRSAEPKRHHEAEELVQKAIPAMEEA
jgi:peptidoglycan/LPS O-acetylase OafA/YrhL